MNAKSCQHGERSVFMTMIIFFAWCTLNRFEQTGRTKYLRSKPVNQRKVTKTVELDLFAQVQNALQTCMLVHNQSYVPLYQRNTSQTLFGNRRSLAQEQNCTEP